MTSDVPLTVKVKAAAEAEGFARVGVARAGTLEPEGAQLDAWLREGRHGQMGWMSETAAVRKDPTHGNMLEGARSVVVMAAPYDSGEEPPRLGPARVAKYALGRDYHNVLTKRARRVARVLQGQGFIARVAVDSKPVFERAWAERAGVGFVGKNCCLIVPGLGSHVFLAAIVTTAELAVDAPIERRCGSCTACLDACPTGAFVGERELDARRCISYLTIEHRGPVDPELREGLGPWMFGCDVCQDVCPFNQGAGASGAALDAFRPGARWDGIDATALIRIDPDRYDDLTRGSPIKRTGREGLARNAAMVLGNRGDETHLPVLRDAEARDASPVVREAAAWAAAQIRRRQGREG